MNKKVNTLLFILCATLFNVLIALLSFTVLLFLYVKFLLTLIPESGRFWGFILIFLAAVAISFFVYRVILKYLMKKVDVEKYFDPFFVRRNVRRRD